LSRITLSVEGVKANVQKAASMGLAELKAKAMAEISSLPVGQLRALAATEGVLDDAIENARDGDDPKGDLINLIVKQKMTKLKPSGDGDGEGEPEPEPEAE
jgi:hypothetical protein